LSVWTAGLRPKYPLITQAETPIPQAETKNILFQILKRTTPKTTCLKCRGLLPRQLQVKHHTIYRHKYLSQFRAAFLASRSFRSPHVKQRLSFRRYGPKPRLRDKIYHLSLDGLVRLDRLLRHCVSGLRPPTSRQPRLRSSKPRQTLSSNLQNKKEISFHLYII